MTYAVTKENEQRVKEFVEELGGQDSPAAQVAESALERLAVMRRCFGHYVGCQCHPCKAARTAWVGYLDLADELVERLTYAEAEALITKGYVKLPPAPPEVVAVCAFLWWAGGGMA